MVNSNRLKPNSIQPRAQAQTKDDEYLDIKNILTWKWLKRPKTVDKM